MMDQPSMRELVDAVREFIERKAIPELKGHSAFHARVAANALGVVSRQLEREDRCEAAELERLRALLEREGSLAELNRVLCQAIRSGDIGIESPELQRHLELTTRDKIEIDQPNYSGLRIARERNHEPDQS